MYICTMHLSIYIFIMLYNVILFYVMLYVVDLELYMIFCCCRIVIVRINIITIIYNLLYHCLSVRLHFIGRSELSRASEYACCNMPVYICTLRSSKSQSSSSFSDAV
jgi:hypothetical protein